jgi:F-type H+-transporting ATPase subunit b
MAEAPTKTTTSIHIPPGERKNFPPFDRETFASQLVWLAVFFIALYVLMARVAIPRIGGILKARSDRIADDIAEAGKLKQQSDEALSAYEKSLADARGRAQALANETRDRLNAQAETARKELEAGLSTKLAAAESTIAATKSAAMANVRGIATDAASAIVQRLIGVVPEPKTVDNAVTEALKA